MRDHGFTEASTVQHGVLARLTDPEIGWSYVPGRLLQRPMESPLIDDEVIASLLKLNPDLQAHPNRVQQILPRVRAVFFEAANSGLVAANEQMVTWLRNAQVIRYQGDVNLSSVKMIDYDEPGSNSLIVSDEVTFGPPGRQRRFDLVLWINGFPVVVGETKSPVNSAVSWLNAARDISNVYMRECSQFFVPNILCFAADGREFHYGAVGQPAEHWPMWGSTSDPAELAGWPRIARSVELLLKPTRLLTLLRDYTLFEHTPGRPTKLIPRYAQVEGAEAIHDRVQAPGKSQGLIWHYQGTGKTLLMAFSAVRLLNDPEVDSPTVLIVLDRVELVEQAVRQFQTVGLPRLRVAGSREDLRRLLEDGTRGVIVTTIFKFAESPVVNTRDNVIVLIDEAHRTQDGVLGDDLRRALPNAQFFGLTGTPIVDTDRNTFHLFGDPTDQGWVLNEYSMSRAIADGTCVPVHVESRLVDFRIDARTLEAAFAELVVAERLDEDEREALVGHAAGPKTLIYNPDRIRAVCADILEHYFARVAPLGLKAQVVVYDRRMCVAYYREIRRLLEAKTDGPIREAAVVMSVGTTKDEPAEWRSEFGLDPSGEAILKRRFGDHEDRLSFLIVTSKLLTGFDAPIEGVMYLDKPLRRHTLFQAVCRTNRRYTNPGTGQEKHFGLVVDYVGLADELARSLRAADPSGVATEHVDVNALTRELALRVDALLEVFDGIDRSEVSIEALFEAQDRLPPGSARDDFASGFLRLQDLWEFLWPADGLRTLQGDYRWLAMVYESIKPLQLSDALLWHRLGTKTLDLVYQSIGDVGVAAGAEQVIVDTETLAALEQLRDDAPEVDVPRPITVAHALDTLEARIQVRLASSSRGAVYVSLSERLDALRRRHLERARTSLEFLRELLDVAREVLALEKAEEAVGNETGLLPDPKLGALTQIFNEYAPDRTPEFVRSVVTDIDRIVKQVRFSGWTASQPGDRTVRLEVRRVLRRHLLPATDELFDRTYSYVRDNY